MNAISGWQLLIAWLAAISGYQCWDLTIIHTNDMHAWLDEGSRPGGVCTHPGLCYGGFPRIKSFTDSIRKYRNNTLFLNAGDNFQGTTYYSLFKWKAIERFVDVMGIDVMSLGNHEFDDGLQGLVPYLRTVRTPWVCANLQVDNEPSFRGVSIQPWKLFKIQGRTVAVIGYLTPETKYLGSIGNLTLLDEVSSLNQASRDVKRLGADVVIALGHSGWHRDLEIARDVPGIDLLVGGHSHTFHYTGIPPDTEKPVSNYPHMVLQQSGKIVPVVQAYAYTKYVGVLNLVFDNYNNLVSATGNPVLMDHTVPEDEETLKLLDVWKENSSELLRKRLGSIAVDLIANECRLKECNMGNFFADAMVDYRRQQLKTSRLFGWTDAPVAVINSGDLRASLTRSLHNGDVTLGDLLTSLPFDETVVKISVNGSVFKQVLEHSVDKYDATGAVQGGQFLQLSGVKVVYDLGRQENSRVVSASIRCGSCTKPVYWPLAPDMKISFLTTSFVSDGGDEFTMLTKAEKENIGESTYFNIVKRYLNKMSPVSIETEGRITFV